MTDRAQFTLQLTLRDNRGGEQPLCMALDLAVDELRISTRAVGDLKAGWLTTMDQAVQMMRTKEFRKDLFIKAAQQLAAQMAERIEDAEGWYDASRIEPARAALGGDWNL